MDQHKQILIRGIGTGLFIIGIGGLAIDGAMYPISIALMALGVVAWM